mgnify:CR=1 FL=1|jgi:hypothetical protein
MVNVNIDPRQKLVDVTLTGFTQPDDVTRAANEIKASMKQFGPEQAVLLIDLLGFAPMSKDVLPLLRGMGRDVMTFFRKTALVQEFAMNYEGGRRAIEPPPGYKLATFSTREEALRYLLED